MISALLAAWPIVKRFWYVVPILILIFVVLIDHARIADKETTLATRNAQVADLSKSNEDAAKLINRQAQARIDNDAIANAVAGKVKVNVTRETNSRTIIERAGDANPAVHNWLSEPVPSVVRGALSAN